MKINISFLLLLFSLCWISQVFAKPLTEADANQLAEDAYIFAYPLVTMDMTRQVMTNVRTPTDMRAPMNQFVQAREYPNASYRDVTAPNADTLYSVAWLDLQKEPYILHVPNEKGRYYLMPMLDGWTEVLGAPGTRTTGTAERNFAIVGPHWKGKLPKGMKSFRSQTDMVWLIGRTYCTGTPEDYALVHAIQDQYTLTPLSQFGKTYTPPEGIVDSSIDMETPVREQVNNMNGIMFFTRFAELLKGNAPDRMDAPIVKKLALLGITPGKSLDVTTLDPIVAKAFDLAPQSAQQKIMAHEKDAGVQKNGWVFSTKMGSYGTDYLQRALVAAIGLGANLPEDAVYPISSVDVTNANLNGANRYVLHFSKKEIPPVRGFWSLTMYNDQYFFVGNPLNRYTLSPRDKLKYNPDGSLDLYVQNDSPGADKESNWLPAPAGDFVLMLRLYWPKESVLSGRWDPPGVQKV